MNSISILTRIELKILTKVLKHLRRHYPGYEIGFRRETKFFIEMYVEDPLLYCNLGFCDKKDFIRRVHAKGLTKQLIFIRCLKPKTHVSNK